MFGTFCQYRTPRTQQERFPQWATWLVGHEPLSVFFRTQLWIRAWHRWAQHPRHHGLTNPVGNIILKLESGESPPDEFLRQAEDEVRLREWTQEQEEHQGEGPAADNPPEPEPVPAEAARLWAPSLGERQFQMTRATFDTWLRGSRIVEATEGCRTFAFSGGA